MTEMQKTCTSTVLAAVVLCYGFTLSVHQEQAAYTKLHISSASIYNCVAFIHLQRWSVCAGLPGPVPRPAQRPCHQSLG